MTKSIIKISNLEKTYDSGHKALDDVSLDLEKGEIFALLGPNGAGKTTLISIICGLVNPTSGTVTVSDKDIIKDYREARSLIGLVPQEITLDIFLTVWETLKYARGFFGKKYDEELFTRILKDLDLYDKKDSKIQELSGGMKRRVLIAKALTNEPEVLFLDEPTAGVDVDLRKSMWKMVEKLKDNGTTIVLTTHYIEEAEMMADRIGIINNGKISSVDSKESLMAKLGKKQVDIYLSGRGQLDQDLLNENVTFNEDKNVLTYSYKTGSNGIGISSLLSNLKDSGFEIIDLETKQSSLEDIFLTLVNDNNK